jgi:hypothetical protein
MKTKLQVSKNVTMNKPDETRQGMKVRTVVTGRRESLRCIAFRARQNKAAHRKCLNEPSPSLHIHLAELNSRVHPR